MDATADDFVVVEEENPDDPVCYVWRVFAVFAHYLSLAQDSIP
jgi:hypothetical protein